VLAEGFDGVLHFAALALVSESVSHPELYYRTNVVGTLHLLDAMREFRVPRLVFSSTCAVYGQPDVVPIAEDAPPRQANAYGASAWAPQKPQLETILADAWAFHRAKPAGYSD
jgi:UDP-glucose 4-epimerase